MVLPRPLVEGGDGCFCGTAPPRMATLVVNKPGAGLDSGRQGSRGTAVVKVRDFACSVLHLRPPFGLSLSSGGGAPAVFGQDARPLRPSRLYMPCSPLRDLFSLRA